MSANVDLEKLTEDYQKWCLRTGNRDITTYAHERKVEIDNLHELTDNRAYHNAQFFQSVLALIATDIFDITSEELASLALFGNTKSPKSKYYLSFWTKDDPDNLISDILFTAGIEERGPGGIMYAVCMVVIAESVERAWELAAKTGLTINECRFIKEKPFSWTPNAGKNSAAALNRIDFLKGGSEAEPSLLVHDADHVPTQSVEPTSDWLPDEDD